MSVASESRVQRLPDTPELTKSVKAARADTRDVTIDAPVADPENELGRGQFRGSGDGSRSTGRGSGGRSPPEADDFSQLKGYLDVTSGILGGHGPLASPP